MVDLDNCTKKLEIAKIAIFKSLQVNLDLSIDFGQACTIILNLKNKSLKFA
jgi:hypothetical protein